MAVTKAMVIGIFGLTILAFSSASPSPQDGAALPQGCRYEGYKTHYTTEYETVYEEKCTEDKKCECHDKPQKVCKTYTEHEPDCNYVEENICTTKYKGVCKPENTTVMEPWEDKKCIDEEKEKCTKKWMTVGYAKVWEIDPTSCIKVKETNCNYTETKYKKVPKIIYKHIKEPFEHCEKIHKKHCTIKTVQKEKCVDKYIPECEENTYPHCIQIHKQVPKQVEYKKPHKVCDHDQGY